MENENSKNSLEAKVRVLTKFPDQNPNPVMKASDEGKLIYANPASELIIRFWELEIGDLLPEEIQKHISQCINSDEVHHTDIQIGPKTFSFNMVYVKEFSFVNIYGTDITASNLINKFPEQNPNPVLKISMDNRLMYANPASDLIIKAWNLELGKLMPAKMQDAIKRSFESKDYSRIEIEVGRKTFSFAIVSVPEFDFINIYGTDITASKLINKFPEQNPNPVLKVSSAARLIFANKASSFIVDSWETKLGALVPEKVQNYIKASLEADGPLKVEHRVGFKTFSFSVVPVPEFDFINIYGTDITAIKQLETAHKENERLLLNVLPASIAERLKKGENVIADKIDEISILFADIVGFTELSAKLSPQELVEFLNSVFSCFDQLLGGYDLEKIKTIGDAYMAVAGLSGEPRSYVDIAKLALEMQEKIVEMSAQSEFPIGIRIGIHTGDVVAGVIGLKKFVYDVWGDTVNTASRMESHGLPSKIQVSEETYKLLKDDFVLTERGLIEIKGKGALKTYFLESEK